MKSTYQKGAIDSYKNLVKERTNIIYSLYESIPHLLLGVMRND